MQQPWETQFVKVGSFGSPYSNDQKLYENLAVSSFESVFIQNDNFRDTNTAI